MRVVLLAGYAHAHTLTLWKSHAAELLLQWLFSEDDVAAAVTRACGGRGAICMTAAVIWVWRPPKDEDDCTERRHYRKKGGKGQTGRGLYNIYK